MFFLYFLLKIFIYSTILSVLLWSLSSLFYLFYTSKNSQDNSEIFECGFRPFFSQNLTLQFRAGLVASFILIYDFEFFLLYPLFTTPIHLTNTIFFLILKLLLVLVTIYITLWWDLKFKSVFLS